MEMSKALTMSDARKRLTSLPEEFEKEAELDAVAVTRRGKPVLAVMPWELYEAITETLEIMADEELTSVLRESLAEYGRGEVIPWEKAREELDL
jgi:antitoxin YefM